RNRIAQASPGADALPAISVGSLPGTDPQPTAMRTGHSHAANGNAAMTQGSRSEQAAADGKSAEAKPVPGEIAVVRADPRSFRTDLFLVNDENGTVIR